MSNESILQETILRLDKAILLLEDTISGQLQNNIHPQIKLEHPSSISNQLTIQELENCQLYIKKLEEANREASR